MSEVDLQDSIATGHPAPEGAGAGEQQAQARLLAGSVRDFCQDVIVSVDERLSVHEQRRFISVLQCGTRDVERDLDRVGRVVSDHILRLRDPLATCC